MRLISVSEEMHRVCTEGEAAAEVHPQRCHAAQSLVACYISGIRVSHICAHSYQHSDISDEGTPAFVSQLNTKFCPSSLK